MGKNCANWKRYSQLIAGMAALAVLVCGSGPVRAAVVITSCTDCHGMPSRDAARKANPHFRSQSSAFIGNHKNHLPAVPVAGDCNTCHPPVSTTNFGHQNNIIAMANSLKGYSSANIRAKYDKGVFVNQTSIPNLINASCSNVSCHFETKTPVWGSTAPIACNTCHGSPPAGTPGTPSGGLAGSHARHEAYFPGTTNCQKCHPGHTSFTHATSVGRPLKVQGFLRNPLNALEASGTYSGNGVNYLPSRNAIQVFGSCNSIYCHSTGQSATGTSTGISYRAVTWGSTAPNCAGCHLDMATDATGTGNHRIHTLASGANMGCVRCHLGYTNTTVTTTTHVNGLIELVPAGFTYSQGSGASHPAANGFGTCSASVCHGSGTVTWGATFVAPGTSFPYSASQCDKCHSGTATAPFYSTSAPTKITANTDAKVGAHTSHLTTPDGLAAVLACADCHGTVALNTATHMNGATNFTWSNLATKGGTLTPTYTAVTRVCANVYCHGASMPGGDTTGTNRTPVWNVAFLSATLSRAACASCHGFPPPTNAGHPVVTIPASWPAVGAATGALGTTCSCHANISATGTTYANIFVSKALHVNGIAEVSGGHSVPFYAHATPPFTSCTGCHNASAAGTYPAAVGAAPNCRGCHVTADPTVTATGCTSCHANPPNGTARPNVVGSHVKHSSIACATCHNGAGSGSGASHGPGNSGTNPAVDNVIFTAAQAGASATWTAATKTCSSTYCHGATLTGGTNKNPIWGTTLTGCGLCHGAPPATAIHAGVTVTQCVTCHTHVNAAGTGFSNASLHMNGVIDASGGTCIGCHASVQAGTHGTPRDAIMSEFGLAWGHKKTGRGAVTDADCIVCHLEGEFATQKTSATRHMDGNIDLRDPDGVGEVAITNISGTAFTFTKFATSYAAGSRTATGHLSNTDIANVISLKFCIKCHDANGATNSTARSGSVPTQYLPFGTGSKNGAAYTVGLSAGVIGGVVDVDTMFAVTNSTFHPVKGPQNNRYASGTRMAVPYGVTKTAVSSGIVMNCFDCHNAPTTLTSRTVAAHGSTAPNAYRGTVYDTTNTLCKVCHTGYTGTTSHHGTGSAFASNTNSGMTTYLTGQCQRCHASTNTAVRPVRSEDAHGFNRFAGTGTDAMWPRGATESYRPYAFMRNTIQWTTTSWKPLSGTGVPAGTATCGGNMSASGCGDSMTTYTPGGTY